MNYKIFTDGASSGNPGPGGWGAVIVCINESGDEMLGAEVFELGGGEKNTTNNRMELTAVIESLMWVSEKIKNQVKVGGADTKSDSVTIYTDSSYVKRGSTEWLKKWQVQNWRSGVSKKEILNKDLWLKMVDAINSVKNIDWKLVGGHIGINGNERADVLATSFTSDNSGRSTKLFSGKLSEYNNLHSIDLLNISDDATRVKEKSKSRSHSRAKAYSYVSLVGGVVRIHSNWADCESVVRGVGGARFKKAISAEDERSIIADFKKS